MDTESQPPMSVPDYYDRVNPDLLVRMPPDAAVVLEVGCGAGALAEAYRRINPDVRYVGIEKVAAVAKAAESAGRLHRVVAGDAESIEPAALGLPEPDSVAGPIVDCLVFGDVLEHMLDPWTALRKLARWLRHDGQVLACIPNIQHYSVLVNLMRGSWEYQDEGLLDRTHLRFFTLRGIQDLFAQSGLNVIEIVPRCWPDAQFERFQQVLTPVVRALGVDPTSFAFQTRAVQYVVRAVPAVAKPRRIVLWSLVGSTIGSEVRVAEPGGFLGTIPGVRVVSGTGVQFDDLGRTAPGEEKVFLQQRVIIGRDLHLRLQRALLERGYLIVAELDDDPAHFAELERTQFFALRACHCVQTTTEVMAESLRAYNPHVAVFANEVAQLPPPRSESPPGAHPVTIVFAALNREADWAPLMPVLNRVLAAHGEGAHVAVVHDRAFFDALATPYRTFEPLCPIDRYRAILNTSDIALLPLAPTRFNRHKSDLKFIECAAHGVAVVAGHTVYEGTIRHGETGLIYRSADEFGELLDRLIRDGPFRRSLALAAHRYVAENRLLARHFRTRHEWYCAMLDRRDQLDLDLKQRVPELAIP
jgi:SAM-dependent methyltransferase